MTHRPLTLQTRLMAAVIGFVSLILIIVAVITSATLGTSLEGRLQDQLNRIASQTTVLVKQAQLLTVAGQPLTAQNVLAGQHYPGLLLAIASEGGASGALVTSDGMTVLTDSQFEALTEAVTESPDASVTLDGLGSFSVTVREYGGVGIVTGLPRDEVQSTMAQLLTVITLATLGGLILLALTTAITIRVSLRPLRAVAGTATRVANQPLDRGEVSITERVPVSEADPRTETGMVGAALNTLLDHVNDSLAARQKNEERMRRFVADASHELRTPLASIRGYSELSLRDRELPETAQTALERIQAQSLRMTRLVEDLLLLARLDEGQELVHGTVDLTRLALEGLTDARPTAPAHHWTIEVPEEPVVMLGDAGRLHQVVANLLANARTHTPDGTTITLSVAKEADEAVIRVHDDGPGIDPQVRDELFARFARGDSSRARQTGGTGLGLAIAKAIVEGHRGTITVDSEPGSTTFTVRFPLTPAPTPASIS
ncbi:cell wall metabolism sensor histidine kinase WalK [Microbacterium sp. AK031]|uniref:sensor histidine kinase n=1 Tax=Microbacterium sp. AK031 TaxID=2723076 RepID=UPI00216A6670|nr:ATP-binding protein [Microbacterium sp. AK031]MCS3845010.1 two-component system OmpR family sensor kinase [Microbacterium sp. AK031]